MDELKLFVWENVLTDYTSGIMFALAYSVQEARQLILKDCDWVYQSELNQDPKIITTPYGKALWGGS